MSIDYITKPDKKLIIVAWDGMIKLGEWQEHLSRMFTDPDFASAKMQLTDIRFSFVDPLITDEEIRGIVEFMALQRNKIAGKKLAIVVGQEWIKAKLVERLLQPLMTAPIVFTDLTTACMWLGLDAVDVGNEIKQMRLNLRRTS